MNVANLARLAVVFGLGVLVSFMLQTGAHWMSTKGPAVDQVLNGHRVIIGKVKPEDNWLMHVKMYAYPSPDDRHRYLLLVLFPDQNALAGVAGTAQTAVLELSDYDTKRHIKPVALALSNLLALNDQPYIIALDMLDGLNLEDWVSAPTPVLNSAR